MPIRTKDRRVSVTSLAEEFNVNVGTISRALNGQSGVGEGLRKKIRKRATELNYRPNQFARSLLFKRTSMIGVVANLESLLFDNPFWGRILSGVEGAAREAGYDLLFSSGACHKSPGETHVPAFIPEQRVDAVLLFNRASPEVFQAIEEVDIPLVQIEFAASEEHDAVITAHREGSHTITRHLIDQGHRHLLWVGTPEVHPNFRERREGFRDAVRQAGAEGHELTQREMGTGGNEVEAMHADLLSTLRQHPRITGIVFQGDWPALIGKNILAREGLRIPDDISVVGFDDLVLAETTYPPLTTMRVQKYALGREAFRLLLDAIERDRNSEGESQAAAPRIIQFKAEMKLRESTGPPRPHALPIADATAS